MTDVVLATLGAEEDGGARADAGSSDAAVGQGPGSDGGGPDGGSADAGGPDGGVADGGGDGGVVGDGGSDGGVVGDGGADGGAVDDGGSPDGGAADAGSSDAGPSDAGAADAGPNDAGIPNLSLVLEPPVVVEVGEVATVVLMAQNAGGNAADNVFARTALPDGGVFLGGAGCTALAGVVDCSFGAVPGNSTATRSFSLSLGPGLGTRSLRTTLTSGTPDVSLEDNFVHRLVGQTAVGTDVVPPLLGRILDGGVCQGSNITSYAQCVPGSLLYFQIALEDAGFRQVDMPDFGGRWGTSPSRRNVGFQFFYTDGGPGSQYWGSTVSPLCFEGLLDLAAQPNRGGWRACVHVP